jgi:acyl carrier protein
VPEALLYDDLGLWDDMDFFGVLMKIEEEFDIDIPDKDAVELSNVGDVLNYILAKVGAKS